MKIGIIGDRCRDFGEGVDLHGHGRRRFWIAPAASIISKARARVAA